MGQDISVYAENISSIPNLHLLPQIQNLQDILPKISKLHKQTTKRDNPAHLNPHEDGAGHDSDVEEDAGNHTKPYRFYRTRIGSPSINRRSFTDEEIDRFIRENDGFPLPCSEEELKAFDQDVFVEYPTATRQKKKNRQRSKSATNIPDLATIRLKLQKIQSPSKPKFLEHLINRVSKKVSIQESNGLIGPLPADTSDDFVNIEPLSPDSEKCLEAVESLAEELIACSQRPASGESCDSGQGSLLESTSDFSPTQKRQSWSTPTSPRFHGIVKQRLQSFQALREDSFVPEKFEKGKERRQSCKENRELDEAKKSLKKFHCALVEDENFTKAVMESGYVKALVSKLNKSRSFDKDSNENLDESQRESEEIINGVKVKLENENADDWPDEYSGDGVKDKVDDSGVNHSRSPSVKDQLLKFETDPVKSKLSVPNSSWKRKTEKERSESNTPKSVLNGANNSHERDLERQEDFSESIGTESSNENLTNSEKSARTFSENQVSKALKRFNHERNKHISSRLTSTASSSYSSLHNNNYVKSPPIIRRPKSSDTAMPNANNTLNGANAKYLEKSRSVELDRSSDTASSSPVSCSFDFGLMPLSPEELFDQNWSKSEFTFDDFSDESDHDGMTLSKKKEEEPDEEPKDKLHKIAYELLTTERAYVTRLHLLDQVFHFRVTVENKNSNFIPHDVVTQVFSHIKPIYQFHHDFLLPQLETRMKNWSQEQRIGDIIAKLAPFLKLYTEYVKNFDNSMNLIDKWTKQSPKFTSVLQEIQKEPECGQLSLQHHMLEPIQRVPRYELLLKEYLKRLDPESTDKAEAEKALGLVTEAASHSNMAMKKLDKFHKLLSILQSLNGEGIDDLVSPTRELVKEGAITKISARSGEKQDRYLFLFNDLLLVCISQMMGKYKVRARLSVDGMEVLPGENLAIQNTFCIKCTEKSVEFLDDANNGEGLDWYAAFQNVTTDFVNKAKLKKVLSDDVSKVTLAEHQDLGSQLGMKAPRWIKDEEVTMCMACQDKFTKIRRRHHCRACGKIFCAKCSSRKIQLQYDNNELNRVCQKCHEILKKAENSEDLDDAPPTPNTPKPVIQMDADESSILSGYLYVMDKTGYLNVMDKNKTWTRRWITVRDDFAVYFYKKHKDPRAITTLPLPGLEVKVMDGTDKLDRQNVFALCHNKAASCYFQTENDDQLQNWAQILKKMVLFELPSAEDKRLSTHSIGSSESTNSSTGS